MLTAFRIDEFSLSFTVGQARLGRNLAHQTSCRLQRSIRLPSTAKRKNDPFSLNEETFGLQSSGPLFTSATLFTLFRRGGKAYKVAVL